MAKQSITVRVEPGLVQWFRTEAAMPLGVAVNEALRLLQHRLQAEQLQQRIDQELIAGESHVSAADKAYWATLAEG